ncbi:hypothetical protein OEZ86_002526 [Tetradesmus obliquus]|nr:hypothetical protein OEZ86_002526 [Tetradesmus obliquus]
MKKSEAGALSGPHAAHTRTTLVFTAVLAGLICVNLVYFLSTHTRIMQQLHANRLDGSGPAAAAAAAAADAPDEHAAVRYLQRAVFYDKTRLPRKPVENYWLPEAGAKNQTFRDYRSKVAAYLNSTEFKQRWDALKQQTTHERGIVMSAGGRYYLPQAIVLLRILRYKHRSKLPVEIFWHGDDEMDNTTLAALKAEFGPLEGYDASKLPYPKHHLPGAKLKGFPMKPWALLQSKFKEAFLLDCDVILRRDPAFMFDAPLFRERGNYFWGDIYGTGMVKDEVFPYVGLNMTVRDALNEGKSDFNRYAESGQVMINRAMHLDVLEWAWFLNSFSEKHIYDFMYGDKDTFGVAFGLAGKAHMYQHINVPPGGVFTNLAHLGWNPRDGQMKKQGNWWLQGLVHYDYQGEVLLLHRVTGEVHVPAGHAPRDEIITPPIPHSWSMWYMGYGPEKELQRSIDVVNYNITYFMGTALPNQVCPLAAWNAYWTLRTHGIPTVRNTTLEKHCAGVLDAEYGPTAANMIRNAGLMEHPLRIAINADWDNKVNGGWNAPKHPLWGVPLNMTEAWTMWQNMEDGVVWAKNWTQTNAKIVARRRAQRRRSLLDVATGGFWRHRGVPLGADV